MYGYQVIFLFASSSPIGNRPLPHFTTLSNISLLATFRIYSRYLSFSEEQHKFSEYFSMKVMQHLLFHDLERLKG